MRTKTRLKAQTKQCVGFLIFLVYHDNFLFPYFFNLRSILHFFFAFILNAAWFSSLLSI